MKRRQLLQENEDRLRNKIITLETRETRNQNGIQQQ